MSNNSTKGLSQCYECGSTDQTTKVEPRRMKLAGGWSISVEDTIVTRCNACGEEAIGYQAPGQLMKAIAAVVVNKRKRLAGPEIRFLRAERSAEEFAQLLGVTTGQLSRWENDHETIGVANDRAVRLLSKLGLGDHDVEALRDISAEEGEPLRLRARREAGKWVVIEGAQNPNRSVRAGLG
jgi:putative zinc finger/helix-turn-helix YgiT family protein